MRHRGPAVRQEPAGDCSLRGQPAAHGLGALRPVIDVSSPEFPCGILAHHDSAHPKGTLGLTGEPHAAPSDLRARAELISLAARRVPIVSVCDGEPGLLDSPGSIVVNQQVPLANRVFNECCRPD